MASSLRRSSICATPTVSSEVLDAYADDEEDFFGHCEDNPVVASEIDEDEEEMAEDEQETTSLSEFSSPHDSEDVVFLDTDSEKKIVQDKYREGCGCGDNCYSQFSVDEVFLIRMNMSELEKGDKDMLILGKLQVCMHGSESVSHARKTTATKRQRVTFKFAYDYRSVCKTTFCFLHVIGEKILKNLQKHLKCNGAIPRTHGNKGKLPPNAFSFDTVNFMVKFIKNYAVINGLPQPAAERGRGHVPPIYLPASEGYNTVHTKYVQSCLEAGIVAAKYHSFRLIWLQCIPHIKFMKPRQDVCQKCDNYRLLIMQSVTEEDKLTYTQQFKEHVEEARKERKYYLDSMTKAEECLASASGSPPSYSHYTFDFAQQLQVPYHSRQVGPIYFKVPLKVQLFGVCNDGTHQQVNYMFSESQSIGTNGTKAHGANAVISMLHHYLEIHSAHEDNCHFHADNCVGQNKNRYLIGYLTWRVITGLHKRITLSFMRVGHTRCMVDGNFGLLKKLYRHSDIDAVSQLPSMVERSSSTNQAQLFQWQWMNWDSWLNQYFTAVKGITKLQHFEICNKDGKISVRTSCDGTSKSIRVLKKGIKPADLIAATPPISLNPGGITRERSEYLYSKIREHVWPPYKDITCPPPR